MRAVGPIHARGNPKGESGPRPPSNLHLFLSSPSILSLSQAGSCFFSSPSKGEEYPQFCIWRLLICDAISQQAASHIQIGLRKAGRGAWQGADKPEGE